MIGYVLGLSYYHKQGDGVVEKKDVCRGLLVNVALLDPSRKPWVTPHPHCR